MSNVGKAVAMIAGGAAAAALPIALIRLFGNKKAAASTPGERNNPPVYYAGSFSEEIGGGWTMLDVRSMQTVDPDKDAHVGMTASLLLSNRGAEPKVFNARILGISGDDFSGQWVGGAPAGGPQMIDFRGANILALHK